MIRNISFKRNNIQSSLDNYSNPEEDDILVWLSYDFTASTIITANALLVVTDFELLNV